jgi:hypothetical protein
MWVSSSLINDREARDMDGDYDRQMQDEIIILSLGPKNVPVCFSCRVQPMHKRSIVA